MSLVIHIYIIHRHFYPVPSWIKVIVFLEIIYWYLKLCWFPGWADDVGQRSDTPDGDRLWPFGAPVPRQLSDLAAVHGISPGDHWDWQGQGCGWAGSQNHLIQVLGLTQLLAFRVLTIECDSCTLSWILSWNFSNSRNSREIKTWLWEIILGKKWNLEIFKIFKIFKS